MGSRKIKKAKPKNKHYDQSDSFLDPNWKCEGCGKCCEFLPIPVVYENLREGADHEYFWQTWGVRTFNYNNHKWFVLHHPCQHLDENKRCRIYEDRPQRCRDARCVRWAGICPDKKGGEEK